jgi:ABC-2 type transport system ATP-binding protein
VQVVKIIQVENLKKHFQSFKKEAGFLSSIKSIFKRDYVTVKALDGISFGVADGEIRGFIGPNGAGKSTTIKILSGILYPTGGSVRVNNYRPWEDRERYVKTIGVVFGQKQQLWLDLPSIDTFNLNKTLYEIPESKYNKNLHYFTKLFEIDDIIKRPVRQLSLGEKMKCELVGSLLHEPPVVFLDEPTIGLDLISKEKIREFIKQVNKDKGITFLLTTHDLDDIENLCHNITIINKGKIVYDGALSHLREEVLNTKLVDIKFKEPVNKLTIKNARVISNNNLEASIEVDVTKTEIKKVMKHIFDKYPLKDVNISNPSIETVIKKIYEK